MREASAGSVLRTFSSWLRSMLPITMPVPEASSLTMPPQASMILEWPQVRLPQAWTVCGGPAYIDAARSLAMQIARH